MEDWGDWWGGEGGEGGGGGGGSGGGDGWGGGDFWDSPIGGVVSLVVGGAIIVGLIGGVGSLFTTSTISTSTVGSRVLNPPDVSDVADFVQPGQAASPPAALAPGAYEAPQSVPEPYDDRAYCRDLVRQFQDAFGEQWAERIRPSDATRCGLLTEREPRRERAVQAPSWSRRERVDQPPQLINDAQPKYPPRALEREQEGLVVVEFTVGADGRVKDAVVVSSQPRGVFDNAALNALERRRYQPRRVDGRPVDSERIRTEFAFDLR